MGATTVGQHTRAGSHFIKFRLEAWCCRGEVRPYAPVALFPNGAAGEGAMSTLFIVSAAALSANGRAAALGGGV